MADAADPTEAFGVQFKFRRDQNKPNGSVWQADHFIRYVIVGYSPMINRYHIRLVVPDWTQQFIEKHNAGMASPAFINSMRRVKGI